MDKNNVSRLLQNQIAKFEELSTSEEIYNRLADSADEVFSLNEMVPEVVATIEEKQQQTTVLNSLVVVLLGLDLSYLQAISFFNELRHNFREKEELSKEKGINKGLFSASSFVWYEKRYWKARIYKEIEKLDLPAKLCFVQQKLSVITIEEPMLRSYETVLMNIEQSLQKEVKIKADEKLNRNLLNENKYLSKNTSKANKEVLTARQAVIFLLTLTQVASYRF